MFLPPDLDFSVSGCSESRMVSTDVEGFVSINSEDCESSDNEGLLSIDFEDWKSTDAEVLMSTDADSGIAASRF